MLSVSAPAAFTFAAACLSWCTSLSIIFASSSMSATLKKVDST